MFTPIEFVRQRAAMINLFARGDTELADEAASFLGNCTGTDPAAHADVGRALFEAQRNMLIASDMYLFTPDLASCARQALDALGPREYVDLDPLPPGAVFAFTEPLAWPGGTHKTSSVMLPMPGLTFVSKQDRDRRLQAQLLAYTLRSSLIDFGRQEIAAGRDVDYYRRVERVLRQRSAPWVLTGIEIERDEPELLSWELLLRAAVTFARSPGIACVNRALIPRNIARAASRAAAPLPDSGVQVIDLRKRPVTMPSEEPENTGQTLQQRVIVRGHWRHQPFGPNRSQRRLVWIDQHLRGPETAPIKGTERVYLGRPPH